MATHVASPSAAPIWRNIVWTPIPVDLDGDHVRITFRVNRGTEFGEDTSASVRIKTVLGQKFLMLEPKGPGQLAKGSEIPLT